MPEVAPVTTQTPPFMATGYPHGRTANRHEIAQMIHNGFQKRLTGGMACAMGLSGWVSGDIGPFREDLVPEEMEYCLLGPLLVRSAGVEVPIPPGKQRVLLAALLLGAGRPVSVAGLTGALWGPQPPPSARSSLHNYVMRLRRVLGSNRGPPVVSGPGGYLIRVCPGELDVERLESALTAGRAAARAEAWEQAASELAAGLALWRGEPFTDVLSEALAAREIPRLAELRLQATEARIDADLHLGRHAEVITELRRLTEAQPLRERLHALLMTALYRDRQQAAALAAYQAARRVLVSELGTEPNPELRRIQQQILAGDRALADGTARPPAAPQPGLLAQPGPGVRYSLPPDTPAFTGRDSELRRISGAIAQTAGSGGAVAIGGMPGVGKTVLAVHAAHLLRDQFPDRQLFIDLRAHTPGQDPLTPQAALGALLSAAGTDPRFLPWDLAGRAAMWRDLMAGQRALLVLDNAASSAQVTPLLPGGDSCLVLVSSRRQLADLPGIPVLVETLPPGQAREMFVRLAPRAAASPGHTVTDLVELAGFLPLAISLLARVYNRHPSWSLADLATETKAQLLTLTAERDSVAAAFEVSWQHLAPDRQDFFRCLGLHPGTIIDAWAAAALAGITAAEAAALLDSLHSEGLLTETGYRRYGMHDLIRRYAADRAAAGPSADRGAAVERLLDYYQDTASRAGHRLDRSHRAPRRPASRPTAILDLPDSTQALAWLRAERTSLLACLDQASRAGQHTRVVALTESVAALLRHDGPWTDAITRHAAAAAAARYLGDRAGRASALTYLGEARRLTGDHPAAAAALEEALGLFRRLRDRAGQASALCELGAVRYSTADYPGATLALQEALGIYPELGNRSGQARTLNFLGDLRRLTGDYPGANLVLEAALSINRDLGDRTAQAGTLNFLGSLRRATGDYLEADRVQEEALGIYRDLGDRAGQAAILLNVGAARRATGDYRAAAQALEEALSVYRGLGSRLGQANALCFLGSVRRAAGEYPDAARMLAEALRIYRDLGDRGAQAETLNETGFMHRARGDLGRAQDCHRQARNLSREIGSAWDEAHAVAGLGRCAQDAGDAAAAVTGLRQAQQIFERIGAPEATGVAAELDALADAGVAAANR
jgi:DNA-binding SARP family transcriptional activator/tetratricopeptide (TPR) repeat protein